MSDNPKSNETEITRAANEDLSREAEIVTGNVNAALAQINEDLGKEGAVGALARGKIFELTKHSEWAARSYELAYSLDSTNLEPLARLIVALIHCGKFQDALNHSYQLTAKDPAFAVVSLCQGELYSSHTLLAESLLLNDMIDEARASFNEALKINPEDSLSAGRMAQISLSDGEIESAIELAAKTGDSPRFKQLRAMATLASRNSSTVPFLKIETIQELAGTASSAVGRPLSVDGSRVRATVNTETDWGASSTPASSHALPRDVAEHWDAIAMEEHSSIASFARLLLEFMHFGVPASLVDETIAAMADETDHARDALKISSRLKGENTGAGTLDVSNVLTRKPALRTSVREALFEGCISETIGALAARKAAETCKDPEIKKTMQKISSDELRHAEVAWHFIEWGLELEPTLVDELTRFLELSLDELTEASMSNWPASAKEPTPDYGALNREQMAEVSRETFSEFFLPRIKKIISAVEQKKQHSPNLALEPKNNAAELISISPQTTLID
ncbi:hypothetical protein [Roseibium sp.]|uniref:hypothetical protein n=1 Tax=Roseibium sp. TaxID=1936156 RepID=UPI003B525387